jgi:membrane-associated phospholipid phosphatase
MSGVVVEEAKRTWQTFRRDWLEIPRERRKRFALTLTAGWIGAALLMLAMSFGLRAIYSPALQEREGAWLARIVEAAPFGFDTAIFLESPGNGVILNTLAVVLAVTFARQRRPLWALGILAACFMVAVVVGLGWVVWDRDRPDFLYEGLPQSGTSAFPSGHSAMSIPVYGFLTYLWLRASPSRLEQTAGLLLLLAALALVILARPVLSAHWPSDVLGGAVLGVSWLGVVILALRQAQR